jgi:iron complex transport system substrate-binding protein
MAAARRFLILLLAALLAPPAAAAPPQRIVSIHLCGDQFALALADREQVVSLSRFARDPGRSYMAAKARGIPQNAGRAEEVVGLRPDLVLAGAFSGRATVQALRSLGYRVMDLALPASLADIREQTMQAAVALGHPERGRALLAGMEDALARARAKAASGVPPLALVWQPHGFASGPGSLEHELLVAAGFRDMAEALGLGRLGHVPLERLVMEKPKLVVNWMGEDAAPSLARDLLRHPALRGPTAPKLATVPHRLWTCPGWYAGEAAAHLAALRRGLDR